MEIVWSDLAVESLTDVLTYIQRFFGEKAAGQIAVEIISFVETLGLHPRMGKQLFQIKAQGEIRCTFYKQNQIYYQICENTIEIIIVWDSRQNPSRLQILLDDFLKK